MVFDDEAENSYLSRGGASLSSVARSEVSSLFSRLRSDLPRANGALSRKKLSSLTTKVLGGALFFFF